MKVGDNKSKRCFHCRVGKVGVEPTVFLMSQIYSLLLSPLSTLSHYCSKWLKLTAIFIKNLIGVIWAINPIAPIGFEPMK